MFIIKTGVWIFYFTCGLILFVLVEALVMHWATEVTPEDTANVKQLMWLVPTVYKKYNPSECVVATGKMRCVYTKKGVQQIVEVTK